MRGNLFSPVTDSWRYEIQSQQKDVARPEFELTSPSQKSNDLYEVCSSNAERLLLYFSFH